MPTITQSDMDNVYGRLKNPALGEELHEQVTRLAEKLPPTGEEMEKRYLTASGVARSPDNQQLVGYTGYSIIPHEVPPCQPEDMSTSAFHAIQEVARMVDRVIITGNESDHHIMHQMLIIYALYSTETEDPERIPFFKAEVAVPRKNMEVKLQRPIWRRMGNKLIDVLIGARMDGTMIPMDIPAEYYNNMVESQAWMATGARCLIYKGKGLLAEAEQGLVHAQVIAVAMSILPYLPPGSEHVIRFIEASAGDWRFGNVELPPDDTTSCGVKVTNVITLKKPEDEGEFDLCELRSLALLIGEWATDFDKPTSTKHINSE